MTNMTMSFGQRIKLCLENLPESISMISFCPCSGCFLAGLLASQLRGCPKQKTRTRQSILHVQACHKRLFLLKKKKKKKKKKQGTTMPRVDGSHSLTRFFGTRFFNQIIHKTRIAQRGVAGTRPIPPEKSSAYQGPVKRKEKKGGYPDVFKHELGARGNRLRDLFFFEKTKNTGDRGSFHRCCRIERRWCPRGANACR